MPGLSFIGKSVSRLDAPAKAAGRVNYTGDLQLPGMLVGRILRSPLPHARIAAIDTSRAGRLRGVRAVLTWADFPERRYGMYVKDQTVLARDRVRYVGEKVAAVAATDADVAEEALQLIRVDYEELPPIFDPLEALRPGAPLIHEDLASYEAVADTIIRRGNVCSLSRLRRGDVEEGFSRADRVFEDTFTTPMVHQGYLEPHAVIVEAGVGGRLTVWTASPSVFRIRDYAAEALGIASSMVKIMAGPVGGSFGAKNDIRLEPVCARLAQKAGRPVRMTMDCREEFSDGNPRHPSISHLKTGVTRDGEIVARQARMIFDTGAYAEFAPMVSFEAVKMINGPYRVANLDLEAQCVYTNKISCGCMRSHGTPAPTFAFESQMDIIAAAMGIDPVEIRLRNAVCDGDLSAAGETYSRISLEDNLRRAAVFAGWGEQPKPKNRGRGVATGQWKTGGRPSGIILKMSEQGKVSVITGCVDVTGSDTMAAQVVAEELGISPDQVEIMPINTDSSPFDAGSSGTRTTHGLGTAARCAAGEMRERLLVAAADMLEANPQDLCIESGRIFVKGTPEKGVPLVNVAQRVLLASGGNLIAAASYQGRPVPIDRKVIEGFAADANLEYLHPVQVAEVEVDPDTGQVTLISLTSIHDLGKVINPASATGQIEGGVLQGAGFGLCEELTCRDGFVLNGMGEHYPQPGAADAPRIEAVMVENGEGLGPYGSKGIGEAPIIATAPAIANAIFDAVGIRIKSLPVTAEKVCEALREKAIGRTC